MIVAMRQWKAANPGQPVPLAMFGTVANAVMWLWTTVGVAAELLFQVIPAAFGWNAMVDVGLSRTLFSWTLHAIVYFWLFPSYIAFYTLAPRAAGGRLYSDTMGRIAFVLFLLYSLPVGLHHLLMDPEHSNGFKFFQTFLTALVSVPTLLTVFTITASMEIAGRMRGGKGLFGWIRALPWDRPMVLATGLAFLMLFFGGGGGLINMSYGMNAMVHNSSWVTAHFHLIFGGTVVIVYFAIAYAMWPTVTGRAFPSMRPLNLQLWSWFVGMMVMTLPWHYLGLQGQWRRIAAFDYSDPLIASWGPWVIVSLVGGIILTLSALLFVYNLSTLHRPASRGSGRRLPLCGSRAPARAPAGLAQRVRAVEHLRGRPDAAGLRLSDRPVLPRSAAAGGHPQAELRCPTSPPADREDAPRRRTGRAGGGQSALETMGQSWRWPGSSWWAPGSASSSFQPASARMLICRWTARCAERPDSRPGSPAVAQPLSEATSLPVSQVSWDPRIMQVLAPPTRRAARILREQVCAACHGEKGLRRPVIPSLAGQSPTPSTSSSTTIGPAPGPTRR